MRLTRAEKIAIAVGFATVIAAWWNRHEVWGWVTAVAKWIIELLLLRFAVWQIATAGLIVWLLVIINAQRHKANKVDQQSIVQEIRMPRQNIIWTVVNGQMQRPPKCALCGLKMANASLNPLSEDWTCPGCRRRFEWLDVVNGRIDGYIESLAEKDREEGGQA